MEHISSFGASPYRIDDIPLLRGASDRHVAGLLAACPVVRVAERQVVGDGQRGQLYIVLRGALTLTAAPEAGTADGAASRILPGECAGEQAVLDEDSPGAAIAALEDSDLLVLEAALVWRLIDQYAVLARNLLRLMSLRARAANAQSRQLGEFYRQVSTVDALTGLNNRVWLNETLPAMVAAAQQSGAPLSLIMLDFDHLKTFNSRHGRPAGDLALRAVAQLLNAALRPSDCAARLGADEMVVILPDTTGKLALALAGRLCERLRRAIVFRDAALPLPHITASFGVASLSPGDDGPALIAAADAALLRAKREGRDRVAL